MIPFAFFAILASLALLARLPAAAQTPAGDAIDVPVLDGDWWQLTGDSPDVAPYTYRREGKTKVCDFTIFKDNARLFHLVACVRDTTAPGDRVFHHWTSDSLARTNWAPAGLFEAPRGLRTGAPTSQQAPHGFPFGGRHFIFYNSGGAARALVSGDGASWKLPDGSWSMLTNTSGAIELFPMGRDVHLFHDTARDRWIAYFCGNLPGSKHGAMVARTAPALEGPWSADEIPVRTEGNPESPFVVNRGGRYYLWQQMSVYVSETPERFEGKPIAHLTGIWFGGKWAPEVLEEDGQFYAAGYGGGIWLCKMKWVPKTPSEIEHWRETTLAALEAERAKHSR